MGEGLPAPAGAPVADALAAVRERCDLTPVAGVILGSGLGEALPGIEPESSFGFGDLPGFPAATAPGHEGRLVLGRLSGVPVAAFLGRIHFYEHGSMEPCSLTVRLARALGARFVVLTAAVGSLGPDLPAGSLVILEDHLNMMGVNPLAGWRFPEGWPAFVPLAQVYDPGLVELAEQVAEEERIRVKRGVYAAVAGPAFETPSEAEFLHRAGGTVAGMSVIPEAVAARALGMRVLGLAMVTNASGAPVGHTGVLREGERAAPELGRLVAGILRRLDPPE